MKDALLDIVKHTGGLQFIEIAKVSGTSDETTIEAMDSEKVVFLKGRLKEPLPDFIGDFGITSFGMLDGLLNHASYRTDEATFTVLRETRGNSVVPIEFQFRAANGMGSDFRLTGIGLVPEQAKIANIVWDVEFLPTKSKIQEFTKLASLFNEFEKFFTVETKNGDLIFHIGETNSSSHRASMVFESNVAGVLKCYDQNWPSAQIISILKLQGITSLAITNKGALQVAVETDYGYYNYIFPARRK